MEKWDHFTTILQESGLTELLEKIYNNADWQRDMIEIINEAASNWLVDKNKE